MGSTANQLAGGGRGAVASRGAAGMTSAALTGGAPYEALAGGGAGGGDGDPRAALLRLAALGDHMAAVRRRIAASLSGESRPLSAADIHSVSSEISSTAHLVVLNAASLLASSVAVPAPTPSPPPPPPAYAPAPARIQELPAAAASAQEHPPMAAKGEGDYDVVELDADELLAEHFHFCEICGKGFRRDANLRMHMRAHGDRFKTLDALSRPGLPKPLGGREVRFSCPVEGCNRNRAHRRFRPLKSAVCARNHFRRTHCPKLYACERCGGKKRFAVLADLRSHLRHCGEEAQWRCSCGTTFSRKDKLFGHIALFEGHTPAITKLNKEVVAEPTEALLAPMEEGGAEGNGGQEEDEEGAYDPEFFKDLMEELGGGAGGSNWPGPAAAGQ